jgi:Alpha/beta hydrolase domain
LQIRRALGFGISQSGRVLRDLVHLGFNQDVEGRQVFDGILPIVAGSRRTCVNWQFAKPAAIRASTRTTPTATTSSRSAIRR